MRTLRSIVAIAAIEIAVSLACTKAKVVPAPASFTVVHAMATGNPIIPRLGTDTSYRYFATMATVSYGASLVYSPVAGSMPFLVVPKTDTVFTIYNSSLSLSSAGMYSFFLSGDTAHADGLLVQDNIPYITDSSAGIRFINLSIGGHALTINLDTDTTHMEFSALGYQTITDFKKYAATASVGTKYNFQIRDQGSNAILKTYAWTFRRYASNTIVISGDPTIPAQFKVFAINNF